MLTSLPHLSEAQRKQLAGLVTAIVKAITPEKIICFGSRSTIRQNWSCFLEESGLSETISNAYDLLIITPNDEKRAEHEIIQMAEQQAESIGCRVISVVHKLAPVNEAIEKGSRFFSTLYQSGVLLYNGNGLTIITPQENLSQPNTKKKIEQTWNNEFFLAERFYNVAFYCLSKNWYELCLFNLHQSVQHSCMVLLRVFNGYHSYTHNLTRLLALTENFSEMPSSLFPLTSKEETELFNLLRNSYSDARYKEGYIVSSEKATILAERVKELLELAERLYHQKLDSLNTEPIISFPITIDNEKK